MTTFAERVAEWERTLDGDSRTALDVLSAFRELHDSLRTALDQYYNSGVSDPIFKERIYLSARATLAKFDLGDGK